MVFNPHIMDVVFFIVYSLNQISRNNVLNDLHLRFEYKYNSLDISIYNIILVFCKNI